MEEDNDGDEVEEREMPGRERKEMGMLRKETGDCGSGFLGWNTRRRREGG